MRSFFETCCCSGAPGHAPEVAAGVRFKCARRPLCNPRPWTAATCCGRGRAAANASWSSSMMESASSKPREEMMARREEKENRRTAHRVSRQSSAKPAQNETRGRRIDVRQTSQQHDSIFTYPWGTASLVKALPRRRHRRREMSWSTPLRQVLSDEYLRRPDSPTW